MFRRETFEPSRNKNGIAVGSKPFEIQAPEKNKNMVMKIPKRNDDKTSFDSNEK